MANVLRWMQPKRIEEDGNGYGCVAASEFQHEFEHQSDDTKRGFLDLP